MRLTIEANQPVAGAMLGHRDPIPEVSPSSHGRGPAAFPHWNQQRDDKGMSEQLQQAYNALMVKAPGAAFQKARALYLNKYPLPQADSSAPLRLYVCDEQLEESIQPANDGDPNHRLAILRSRPGQLAVVHWQQAHPPEPEQLRRYLHDTWTLNLDDLEMEAMSIPWFREGGHQSRFAAPKGLGWQQQTLLTLKEEK